MTLAESVGAREDCSQSCVFCAALNTIPNADVVMLYDGDSDTSQVLSANSGSSLPSAITSTGSKLRVRWRTDYA